MKRVQQLNMAEQDRMYGDRAYWSDRYEKCVPHDLSMVKVLFDVQELTMVVELQGV